MGISEHTAIGSKRFFAATLTVLIACSIALSMSMVGTLSVSARQSGIMFSEGTDGTPTAPPVESIEPTTAPGPDPADAAPLDEVPQSDTDESTNTTVESPPAPEEPVLAPALTWALDSSPECRPEAGSAEAIASGGSMTFDCTSSITINGVDIVPASISIDWELLATTDGDWSVAILPPLQSEWIESTDGVAWIALGGLDHGLTGDAPAAIDNLDISITYRLRIERASCDLVPRETRLEHSVSVSAAGAVLTDVSATPETLRLSPVLLEIPEPVVKFDGPLNFGSVGTTAAGPVEPVRTGTLSVTVSGLDQACGGWTLHLNATPLVDERGDLLPGASLFLVAVGDEPVPDGGCDLAAGCAAATFMAGPAASATRQITLTIELRIGAETPLGAFGTTIDATLNVRG